MPGSVVKLVHWWNTVLASPGRSCSLSPHHRVDPDIWADASSSWGISIVCGDHWATWHLKDKWMGGDRDIGWAESVALELAILWLVQHDFADCEVIVRGDNTGVIGAFNKGRLCNISQNAAIHRMASSLVPFNIMILPTYVTSLANRADPVSHGALGPLDLHLNCSCILPPELSNFLSYA